MSNEIQKNAGEDTPVASALRSVEKARANLDGEQRAAARREMGGWLQRMKESARLRGPVRALAALFLGVPLSAAASETNHPPEQAQTVEVSAMIDVESPNPLPEAFEELPSTNNVDVRTNQLIADLVAERPIVHSVIEQEAMLEPRYPETDQFYLFELVQVAKAIEGGQAAPEYYARVGRPEWTPYQRSLFSEAPVQERFTELHPEYRGLSGEQFLDAYPDMMKLATTEFRFSNQARFLSDDAIDIFVSTVGTMEPTKSVERYELLLTEMGRDIGLAQIVKLTDALSEILSPDHPVLARAAELGVEDAKSLVGRSKDNVVHMDQARGQLRVLRPIEGEYLLIDTFPAIGGPLNSPEMGVSGTSAVSEFVHVPNTVLRVSYIDRAKTSWSWHNSWVPQGAPIREAGDQLQYQHPTTKQWYYLTGSNAGFFPDKTGHTLKPFDKTVEPMDLGLIRAASKRTPNGTKSVPNTWTKDEILNRNHGVLPTEWRWNDFGSMSARLNTASGERTNINIHSRPNEDPDGFLGSRTHGCLATFGDYMKALTDEYGMGSGTTVFVTTEYGFDLNALKDRK
ncbi:hypothetical protein A2348_04060 [Candidatus Uhrbacteria bacterium RIFOXYB12_FULL_58_10]|uniref:YkuD domain-containing protein n=1 Tax=Candidatus Uhrbacteria bacterium RIFOXYB2_FULL_57_15 TaxID=1802422 RepID=A0A1F7W511_9BACT|nr:MAG: hypothetical protein A2348_04060 [Candidatus Uhrbacteria bacterium RIFOXYB12_FULL_58_10]OGL97905.1 MAG: hypothetical protein A2304_03190 [Candidatus Uhrbacteria bacterium RIFOXYB2_FULL_57_15]OGL99906.1 MAG: hypothetical protein A2501_05250 [Candidatus Uhrbacteria bacterium RIFOXYC12_FULL_57_11]